MIDIIGTNKLEIQDTGAARGERNFWWVNLNGVPLFEGYSRKRAEQVHETVLKALKAGLKS